MAAVRGVPRRGLSRAARAVGAPLARPAWLPGRRSPFPPSEARAVCGQQQN